MDCPKCGAATPDQSIYCNKCGERVDTQDREAPSVDGPIPESPPEPADASPPPAPAANPAQKFSDMAAASRTATEDEPEEELWQGGYSSRAMVTTWGLAGLASVGVLTIWILWIRSYWLWMIALVCLPPLVTFVLLKYRQWSVRYRLTSQRFIHQLGILRRVTDRIELIDIDDITFEQGLIERLLGVGSIRISSSDRTHPEIVLVGIANVKDVAELIDNTRRSERRRRGLHIESI